VRIPTVASSPHPGVAARTSSTSPRSTHRAGSRKMAQVTRSPL
jgi:hypothetical protein